MSMWLHSAFLLVCILAPVHLASTPRIRVDISGRFRDDVGRQRLFHGFNNVLKGFPWYDASIFNKTRLSYYQKWGFNAARLGCMWTGVAPKKGMYNETYLNITMSEVKLLSQYGIYTLLDMHQDVISSRFGSYDGVPTWVIDSFPPPTYAYPFPLTTGLIKSNWGLGYLTNAVAGAFQHLYKNTSGALDHWGDFWVKVATTFKAETSVIGYELINEPFAGNFYENLKVLLPGVADRTNLMPAYDKLVPRIRAVDSDTLIFYEPVTWGIFNSGSGDAGVGFTHVPGGDSQRTKSALSYHYYCWILTNASAGYSFIDRVVCDDLLAPRVFPAATRDVKRLGGASFLTEFGLCAPDGNPDSINTHECEMVMDDADKYIQSWTYWDSKFFDSNGQPRMTVVRAFARSYPRAVAGNITAIHFDVNTGQLDFSFKIDPKITAHTEVFLPISVHYTKGFTVAISPQLQYTFDPLLSSVLISNKAVGGGLTSYGQDIQVKVTAK